MIALLIFVSTALTVFAVSFGSALLGLFAGLAIVLTVSVAAEAELKRERRSRHR